MITIALTLIHVLVSLFLILVVLLQQGKGADLSVFGGGGTQAAFGARGAATILHKLTVGGFITFVLTTIAIGLLSGSAGGGSVMDSVATETPAAVEAEAGTTEGDAAEPTAEPAIGVGADTTSPDIEVDVENPTASESAPAEDEGGTGGQ